MIVRRIEINAQTGEEKILYEDMELPAPPIQQKDTLSQIKTALIKKGVISEADLNGN